MNTRPTPETDAFAIKFKTTCGEKYWVPVDIARKLERERDELRRWTTVNGVIELERERDEARGQANDMREKWLAKGLCCEHLGAELHDAICQRDEARDEARGQRDRLAGALRIIAEGTSCRECGGEDQALLAREALQSLFCDALKSLTPKP